MTVTMCWSLLKRVPYTQWRNYFAYEMDRRSAVHTSGTILKRSRLVANLLAALGIALGFPMVPSLIYSVVDESPDLPGFVVSVGIIMSVGTMVFY